MRRFCIGARTRQAKDVLGSRFEGIVEYEDRDGNEHHTPVIVNWSMFRNTRQVSSSVAQQVANLVSIFNIY